MAERALGRPREAESCRLEDWLNTTIYPYSVSSPYSADNSDNLVYYQTSASAIIQDMYVATTNRAWETTTRGWEWQPTSGRGFGPALVARTYVTSPSAAPEPLTQEEADRRLAATRETAHKAAIRRSKAVKKGRKLLLEVLTEAQKQEYARTKSFTVIGANGRAYRLRKGGTTHELDESGLPILSHCIHLPYSYIDEDTLVAVKMLLETDPREFLKIANTSRLAPSLGISVPAIPQVMEDRATALAGGFDAVNERFFQLSIVAEQARTAAQRLGRAFEETGEVIRESINIATARIQNATDYADYARELEHQVVMETVGPVLLPPAAQHQHVARTLGHAEDITGVAVAA